VLRIKLSDGRQFRASKSPTYCSCKTLWASFNIFEIEKWSPEPTIKTVSNLKSQKKKDKIL
jgi:hypothetical protein